MNTKKTAVVLINVGTPDSPDKKSVKKYLKQFLNDPEVIDIPAFLRYILVNFIIIPFRAGKSAKLYKKLWNAEGSPLLVYTQKLVKKLNQQPGNQQYYCAMRYGNPNLWDTFSEIKKLNYDEIVVIPMFPQYASSTTGSAIKYSDKIAEELEIHDKIKYIDQFYNHPLFVNAFAERLKSYSPEKYDYVIFSFHGLPLRHIRKIHPQVNPEKCNCETELPDYRHYCYKATCYETARLIAQKASLVNDNCSVAFQSRLSKNWLNPFTDDVIKELAKKGIKSILVIAPAFVTDCLETIVEINDEYQNLLIKHGGTRLTLVESLNDWDVWAAIIPQIIDSNS